MELISFAIGYTLGKGLGRFGKDGNTVSERYALFTTREEEALTKISSAYSQLHDTHVYADRFNKDGDLVKIVQNKKGKTKEKTDDTISIDRFLSESLLKIELYDSDMYPIGENIMLTRYLIKDYTG